MLALAEHALIPISFTADRVLVISPDENDLGRFNLSERRIEAPYLKDYDSIDGVPAVWPERFDLSNWGLISAHSDGRRLGGVVMAFDTAGVDMLEGRSDLAVLWDIRVRPEFRRREVGSALFRAAERWAVSKNCRQLKVETQNINVAACRFYARQGCELRAVNPFAYKDLPDEIQMLWYKQLPANPASG